MASLFEKKDRHVIPNWRSFNNTAKLGELNGSKSIQLDSTFKPDISDLLDAWDENKNIGVAGDILGVALVCNQEENPKVKGISEFVLANKETSSQAIIDAAQAILKPKNSEIELVLDIKSLDDFDNNNFVGIHSQISDLKKKLIVNPLNSILWIEIARFYLILGQENKAQRAIKNAIFLSPDNRFVLRSASRFLVHSGDFEFAHDIVRKSQATKYDPWLLATEISLATLRGRQSKFVKIGQQIINQDSFHPFNISELASSLATLEMESSLKKSKKLFEKSLIKPNDNSLAQAEWASQEEDKLLPINIQNFQLINSFEAWARDFHEQNDWEKSIEYSKRWFLDLPFSKGAILFGSEIASRKLKDHDQAVEIAKLGLLSHPKDGHLLNNIIYSLCLRNRLEEAENFFKTVPKEDTMGTSDNAICLIATKGLFFYRKGFPDIGRQYYYDSMKISQEQGREYLNSLAFVNFAREEILLGQEDMSVLIPRLENIAKYYKEEDIAEEANDIIGLYNSKKQGLHEN